MMMLSKLASHSCHLRYFRQTLCRNPSQIFRSSKTQSLRGGPEEFSLIASSARKKVGWWLVACSGLTFATVVVGGVTRLTKSGLSIVDWHPFKEFPPFNATHWQKEFEKYQQFPEYQRRNTNMTLEEFKWIWYMEYAHRMAGRIIGAAFAIPATYFWYKKYLVPSMKRRVVLFGCLLLFQGFLGWYMVKSGLDEKATEMYAEPRVSHYRLAAHLGTAFVFYTLLLWSGLTHLLPPQSASATPQMIMYRRCCHGAKGLIFLTAISGAFVAGLDAGLHYNSWPKMADRWIPSDINTMKPWWKNIFDNATTVQFDHRLLGHLVFCTVTGCWLFSGRLALSPRMKLAINCLMIATVTQVGLGITSLLLQVPKPLAATHQAGALTLLSVALWVTHELKLIKRIPK